MEKHENELDKQELVTNQTQEISILNRDIEELRKEVKQLREDVDLIDVFQKKPIINASVIGQIGSFIIAILVIIGIFF